MIHRQLSRILSGVIDQKAMSRVSLKDYLCKSKYFLKAFKI